MKNGNIGKSLFVICGVKGLPFQKFRHWFCKYLLKPISLSKFAINYTDWNLMIFQVNRNRKIIKCQTKITPLLQIQLKIRANKQSSISTEKLTCCLISRDLQVRNFLHKFWRRHFCTVFLGQKFQHFDKKNY